MIVAKQKNRKRANSMKISLSRAEIQQAISCFLKQKGLEHEDFSMTINYNGATIDLDKTSEEIEQAIAEHSEQPEPIVETTGEEKPAAAVEAVKSFGSFGSA